MIMHLFSKVTHTILITGFGIITLLAIFYIADTELFHSFDQRRAGVTKDFQFDNSIVCTVEYSTHHSNRGPFLQYLEQKQFTLDKLDTDTPTLDGYDMEKAFNSDDYTTIRSKFIVRSSEVISIMKKTGQFTRSVMGTSGIYGNGEFPFVVAQKGRCE